MEEKEEYEVSPKHLSSEDILLQYVHKNVRKAEAWTLTATKEGSMLTITIAAKMPDGS